MGISQIVLADIATKLLAKWAGSGANLPNPADLQAAISSLLTFGELVLPSNLTPADVNDGVLNKIAVSISQFKNLNHLLQNSPLDLIFDAISTAKAIRSNCNGTANSSAATFSINDKMAIISYRIDDSIRPTIDGTSTKDLIEAAVEKWAFRTDSLLFKNVTGTPATTFCNVRIIESDLGTSGRVLGQAPHAGPGRMRDLMTLELNFNVKWNINLFMGTVTHEMGHIAGLDHIPGNDLMNDFLPQDMITPQAADLAAFNALWP